MRRFAVLVNFFLAARLADYRPRCSLRPLAPGAVSAPVQREPNYSKGCGRLASVSRRKSDRYFIRYRI